MIQFGYDNLDRQTTENWQQSGSATPSLTVATTQDGGPINEIQSVGWTTSAYGMSGTYSLSFNGQTTSAIAWNADAATITSALESLSSVGSGNVAVTVTIPSGSSTSRTLKIEFKNGKGATNVAQTTINTGGLTGYPFGTPSGFANTTVTGGDFTETQTITLSNASGGTWRVAYNGEVSAPLSPSINASQLKSVLDGFIGIDNVTVTGSSGIFTVTFGGTQSTTNMQQILGDAANASNGSTVRTITTAYDADSQITSISDPSSTINFTLDNLGRAITIAQSVNGLTPTVTLNQSFDAMNNRTELKASIGSTLDFKNTYQYDQLQRLTDIIQQGQSGGNTVLAKHVTFAYNAQSQRTQIARYQSTGTTSAVATTDFTYDSANRLSGIAHKQGTTNLDTYAYTYDPLSRIATIVSTLEGTDTYSYDQTSQLVGATHTSQANETYGFDANGNRNTTGFTTGTNNQTTAGLGFTYTFDDEGNRTSKTETATGKVEEYTWDFRNRLNKVVFRNSSGGAIVKQVDYEYDPYNRLVHRTFDADGAGSGAATDQFWVYDEGINAVLQFDGSSASNLSHRYLWSNNVDELLADEQIAGSNTLWGLADHLGSLRDIADLNEGTGVTSITNHRTFNSFGKLISETNAAVDMLFAFTGKQYDEAYSHGIFGQTNSAYERQQSWENYIIWYGTRMSIATSVLATSGYFLAYAGSGTASYMGAKPVEYGLYFARAQGQRLPHAYYNIGSNYYHAVQPLIPSSSVRLMIQQMTARQQANWIRRTYFDAGSYFRHWTSFRSVVYNIPRATSNVGQSAPSCVYAAIQAYIRGQRIWW
jgi:hypothetical protein